MALKVSDNLKAKKLLLQDKDSVLVTSLLVLVWKIKAWLK